MQQRTVQHAGFLLLLVLVTIAFVALIAGFLQPVFWAAVLAVIVRPATGRIEAALGGRHSLAAILTCIGLLLLVFVPLSFIGVAVSREAIGVYDRVSRGEIDVPGALKRWEPLLLGIGARVGIDPASVRGNVADAAGAAAQFIASQALAFGQNAVSALGQTTLMLYLLFFFVRDGDRILVAVGRALPLGDAREKALFAQFTAVTRATLKGTLAVGALQGTIGGILFWLLGLDAPAFWGVVMTAASIVPVVGPTIVWVPAAFILIATGAVAKGIILLAVGTGVIGLVDNVLRPILVGREARMPDYIVLLSTLGGLSFFGLSGFVAGPVLAALFLTSWQMFALEYGRADKG